MFETIAKFIKRLASAQDARFCFKVSVAQSALFFFAALLPLIVDPQLVHHVKYGARHYSPVSYVLAPFLAVATLVLTMWLLTRIRPNLRIWFATLPSWMLSLPMFWFLREEFPLVPANGKCTTPAIGKCTTLRRLNFSPSVTGRSSQTSRYYTVYGRCLRPLPT